jgi:hypothetical protein
MHGRRKTPRNLCADLLKIRWKDKNGAAHHEYAALEDISEGGICLQLESEIAPGTQIAILYPRGRYEGVVKYCRSDAGYHLLGVQFLPGYRWTRRQYDPAHLLQFRLKIAEHTR